MYFILTALVTWLANRHNREEEAEEGEAGLVRTHFLGGKKFGLVVLYLTTFATYFSGYTCVGVPNDAFKQGYNSLRWYGGHYGVGFTILALYPRLRSLSKLRNYESPGDFIMDRFGSTKLRVLSTISMCLPMVFYISVQFHSLGSLASQLTDGALDFYVVVIVSVVICLAFEFLGGMRSVAYTDAVESTVMIAIFVIVPLVILARRGGFGGQVAFANEQCDNHGLLHGNETLPFGCVNYIKDKSDDPTPDIPYFFTRTPSTITNANMLIFYIAGASYPVTPIMLQRLFIGKSDYHVKLVSASTFVNSYFATTCGILIGLTVLANSQSYESSFQKLDGFFMFINQWLYEESVGLSVLMYLLILSAMAGIMSTADSSLIGVSNTVTVDIFRNWLMPNASGRKIVFIGKVVSIITATLGAGLAIYLEVTKDLKTGVSYSVLLSLQGGIGWQILPAFILGLYTDISSTIVTRGCALGLFVFLGMATYNIIIAGADKKDEIHTVWTAINPNAVKLNAAINALVGAIFNFGYCIVAHLCCAPRKESTELVDTRYGPTKLTHKIILQTVGNKSEPIFFMRGIPALLIPLCAFLQVLVRTGPVDGDLKPDILFNGEPNKIIAGLPAWAYWQLMVLLLGSVCGLWSIMQWDVSDEGSSPADGKNYDVEMTTESTPYVEMGEEGGEQELSNPVTGTQSSRAKNSWG